VLGPGVIEAGKDKVKIGRHGLKFGNFRWMRKEGEKNLAKSFFLSIFVPQMKITINQQWWWHTNSDWGM
jgi:hypothetical protein